MMTFRTELELKLNANGERRWIVTRSDEFPEGQDVTSPEGAFAMFGDDFGIGTKIVVDKVARESE